MVAEAEVGEWLSKHLYASNLGFATTGDEGGESWLRGVYVLGMRASCL